eukprot:TRINITY_DN88663_c0_g1_i1.p11 TRINITY_DN88663_c0_g1~~TRINITY_DN88663_c0_g1_i1.p11  ORF type:complete len:173 (-),score=12.35 TRINITY_DN88663_c0_g1_i1:73-591(-)
MQQKRIWGQRAFQIQYRVLFQHNQNIREIKLVKVLVLFLSQLKLSIGVVSPYAAQVERLRNELTPLTRKIPSLDLEVSTIDGYQGREKDAIIISMVRSNDKSVVGFIAEEKRMNVAITRARMFVAIVGDSSTICSAKFLNDLVQYIAKNGKRFRLEIENKGLKVTGALTEIK